MEILSLYKHEISIYLLQELCFFFFNVLNPSLPMDSSVLNTAQGARWYRIPLLCRRHKRLRFNLWVRKIPWRKKRQLTPVFLPGKSHRRSRVGYSPWGHNESDVTEHTHVHTHTHTHTQKHA